MASVQEQMHLDGNALDKWSIREHLCLVSVVSGSSDLNWKAVSKSLKLICGNNRPADWFSHKSCAMQYEQLLENFNSNNESQARDGAGKEASTCPNDGAESAVNAVLKQLTDKRIRELKARISKEQEEYAKVFAELKEVQSGQPSEERILELWKNVEQEQEMERIKEMKLENQLREREQQKQELERNWRITIGACGGANLPQEPKHCARDAHTDDIGGNTKTTTNEGQQQAHATAPTIATLLTGGAIDQNQPAITLKNTIPASEAAHILTRPISGPPTEASASSTPSQNIVSPSQSAPTLSMLLEKSKVPAPAASVLSSSSENIAATSITTATESMSSKPQVDATVSDSNNEEVPMDIEEDISVPPVATNEVASADDSDADINEEQQLLEVFKNIGNIDELEDIDVAAVINEEVDFLKGVEDASPDATKDRDFEAKPPIDNDNSGKAAKKISTVKMLDIKSKTPESTAVDVEVEGEEVKPVAVDGESIEIASNEVKLAAEGEASLSDDSNDDIPLATLGNSSTHEGEQISLDADEKHNDDEVKSQVENSEECDSSSENSSLNEKVTLHKEEDVSNQDDALKSSMPHDASNEGSQNVCAYDENKSNDDKEEMEKQTDEKCSIKMEDNEGVNAKEIEDDITAKEETINHDEVKMPLNEDVIDDSTSSSIKDLRESMTETPAAPVIMLFADTDEDSSATEVSAVGKKEDKPVASLKLDLLSVKVENAEIKTDAKGGNDATTCQTPTKMPSIRKLKDRDRSESPMTAMDEDTTASDYSTSQRSKRRHSSTPIFDSIPNSPVSSDREERDTKTSKKCLMGVFNALTTTKSAAHLQRSLVEESPKLKQLCFRQIDFQAIKKNIESNSIRNLSELQRDFLLLGQNMVMTFETNSENFKTATEFVQDCQNIKDFVSNGSSGLKLDKDTTKSTTPVTSFSYSSGGVKVRGGARKSQRIS